MFLLFIKSLHFAFYIHKHVCTSTVCFNFLPTTELPETDCLPNLSDLLILTRYYRRKPSCGNVFTGVCPFKGVGISGTKSLRGRWIYPGGGYVLGGGGGVRTPLLPILTRMVTTTQLASKGYASCWNAFLFSNIFYQNSFYILSRRALTTLSEVQKLSWSSRWSQISVCKWRTTGLIRQFPSPCFKHRSCFQEGSNKSWKLVWPRHLAGGQFPETFRLISPSGSTRNTMHN